VRLGDGVLPQLQLLQQENLMANPQKRKGDSFERVIVGAIKDAGLSAWRTAAGWTDDRGDVAGISGVVVECKDHVRPTLGPWLKELAREVANAGARRGVVVFKRKGTADPEDQFVLMTVKDWLLMEKEIQDVSRPL